MPKASNIPDAASVEKDIARVFGVDPSDSDPNDISADDLAQLPADDDPIDAPTHDMDDDGDDSELTVNNSAAQGGEQPEPEPEPEAAFNDPDRYQIDSDQNVIDPRTGKVLAQAGGERRLFQELHRTQVERADLARQNQQLGTQLRQVLSIAKELDATNKAMRDTHGLDANELREAAHVYGQFKSDPKAALQTILTKLAINGTDMSSLGLNQPMGLDAKALSQQIENVIAQRMAPFEAMQQQQAQQSRANAEAAEADREVRQFFTSNPEAVQHVPTLRAILGRFPNMGLNEAWLRLRNHQLTQQRQASSSENHGRNGQPPQGKQRAQVQAHARPHANALADVNEDYGAIINSILDEAKVS